MSLIHERLKAGESGTARWFLKVSDDLIYGPVSMETLYDWATEGRIAPGHLVSNDKTAWAPAESFPSLRMECVVDNGDGKTYGPFNLLATPHLVQQGLVRPDALIRNTLTGQEIPADSVSEPSPTTAREGQATGRDVPLPDSRRIDELREQLEVERLRQTQTAATATAREEELNARLAALEDELLKTSGLLSATKKQLTAAKASRRAAKKRAAAKEEVPVPDPAREQAESRVAELEADLQKQTEELEAARGEAGQEQEKLRARIRKLEEDIEGSTSLLETARQEITRHKSARDEKKETREKKERDLVISAKRQRETADKLKGDIAQLRKQIEIEKGIRSGDERDAIDRERKLIRKLRDMEQRTAISASLLSSLGATIESSAATLDSEGGERPPISELTERIASLEESVTPRTWYLRLEDESVFGPVSLAELTEWAADCRIGPDHRVSTDQEKWTVAVDTPELGMDWMVQLVDGNSYGPIHIAAVKDLLANGAVSADAQVENRRTGETIQAGALDGPVVTAAQHLSTRLTEQLQGLWDIVAAERERNRILEEEASREREKARELLVGAATAIADTVKKSREPAGLPPKSVAAALKVPSEDA